MLNLGKCVVIVEDGEELAPVRVENLSDNEGQAKLNGKWEPVTYVGRRDGKLVFSQEEDEE